jgi:hypothetical protein
MSIYDGIEDALSKEAGFAFIKFNDEYRGDKARAQEHLKQRFQYLIEIHDIAMDILEEVMKSDEKEET